MTLFRCSAIAVALLSATTIASGLAKAETRAAPFPAWPEPKIQSTMTVEEARAIVEARTKPQAEWKGPTSGPKAEKNATIAYVSDDQSYTSYVGWGQGVIDAATALGWKVVVLDGKAQWPAVSRLCRQRWRSIPPRS